MNIATALSQAKKLLREQLQSPEHTPDIDADILLAFVLGADRSHLISHSEQELSSEQLEEFHTLIKKRAEGVPISHLLGKKEFFGMEFFVNEHVLTPRPETEILVEKALEIAKQYETTTLLDIGTGSGCIAISLRKNLPENYTIIASDVSPKALQIAQKNATRLDATNIEFIESNLLESIEDSLKNTKDCHSRVGGNPSQNKEIKTSIPSPHLSHPTIIIANLPYIPTEDELPREVRDFDPPQALFAGADGLELYRIFFYQLQEFPFDVCLFEFHPPQKEELKKLLSQNLEKYDMEFFADLSGDVRFGLLS